MRLKSSVTHKPGIVRLRRVRNAQQSKDTKSSSFYRTKTGIARRWVLRTRDKKAKKMFSDVKDYLFAVKLEMRCRGSKTNGGLTVLLTKWGAETKVGLSEQRCPFYWGPVLSDKLPRG